MRSVDTSTENFSVSLKSAISSLHPRVKTYLMGDQISEAENFQPTSILEITKISTNLKQSNSVGRENISTNIISNINILPPKQFNVITLERWMGLRVQSTVGCFLVLCFLQFSVVQVIVGLRKQFMKKLFFPIGSVLLILIII